MRIAFLLPVYHIFQDRCLPLSLLLQSAGHSVKVFISHPGGCPDDGVPIIHTNWPNFDFASIDHMSPDLLIIWNGYFDYHHAAVKILKTKYRTSIIEMGWFPQRTNSYIAEDLAQSSKIAKILYEPEVAKSDKNQEMLIKIRSSYNTDLPEGVDLPERFFFIPMQLDHDTQIVYTSNIFKTMNSFIHWVKRNLKERIPVIIRNHPLEVNAERPNIAHNFTEVSPSLPLAVRSSVVIGINSTMLSEVLLFHKRVHIAGTHVCQDIMRFTGDVFSEGLACSEDTYKDVCDYRALVLLYNQWESLNPPGWVVDSVISMAKGEYEPRRPV